jgi:hypothetical protein
MMRVVLPFLGVLLAVATGEIAARLHGDRICIGDPGAFYETDPRFGWRHRTNLRGWVVYCDGRPIPASPVETDAGGLLESPLETAPPGAARMLVVGGVLPEGLGVPPTLRLSRMLQDRADVRRGRALRVLNAGTASFAIDNVLLWFRAEGVALHPDLVLLVADPVTDMTAISPALISAAASRLPWKPYLVLNDDHVEVVTPAALQDDRTPPAAPSLLDRSALARFVLGASLPRGPAMGWLAADPTGRSTGNLETDRANGRALVRAILRTLRDEVAATGATLVVAMGPLPRLSDLGEDSPEKPLRAILTDLAIPTVDLGPPLWGMRKHFGAAATFEGTTRLNRAGHFVASQVIWDFLVRKELLPHGVVPVRLGGAGEVGAWRPFPAAFLGRMWQDREGLVARTLCFGLLAVALCWMGAFLSPRARTALLAATSIALPMLFVEPRVVLVGLGIAVAIYAAIEVLPGRLGALAAGVLIAGSAAAATRWLAPTAVTIEPDTRLYGAFATNFAILRLVSYAVARRRGAARLSPLDFLAGLFFFPTFAFGPVTTPADIAASLAPPLPGMPALVRRIGVGALRLIAGTLLVAASVQLIGLVTPDVGLSAGDAVSWPRLWLWVLEAFLALTFFHAGWTLVARALAGLIGIELPANFRRPWAAADAADFWRRWYATLGGWLDDHVARPLGRRGVGAAAGTAACLLVGTAWYGWLLAKLYGLGANPAKPVAALLAFALAQAAVLAVTARLPSVLARAATVLGVPLGFVPLEVIPWGGVLASLGILRRLVLPALVLVLLLPAGAGADEIARAVDLSTVADCSGRTDATAAIAHALAGPGRALVVPAGCRLLVTGPAAGGATFVLPTGTTIRCENHAAGFALARRACAAGPSPGAACDADRDCGSGGRCALDTGTAPFAPDENATYTLFRAAEGATDVALVGCGIFANQLEPYARCAGGPREGTPCESNSQCAGSECMGPPRAPAGPGRIVAVDLQDGAECDLSGVWVFDQTRGVSFQGGRRIERCRNDAQGIAATAPLAVARFALDGIVVGSSATVRDNRIIASGRGISALGSYVTIDENRVGEARGALLRPTDPVTGIYFDGGQIIASHNHVTTFNCIRGGPLAVNVTVSGNRCFSGAGAKIVVTGAGWMVTDNYLAWDTGSATCIGGPKAGEPCAPRTTCPDGVCPAGAPVLAIGDDGTRGWTAGGTIGGAEHPIIANNLLFTNAGDGPLIGFAHLGRRCAGGERAGSNCVAPADCACRAAADCGRAHGLCVGGHCTNPDACEPNRLINGNVTGNLLLAGPLGARAAIDLSRVSADTVVSGWLFTANHFVGGTGIRMPPDSAASVVSDIHVLPNAYTLVSTRLADWRPTMGELADGTEGPRTISLASPAEHAGVAGDVVVASSDADAAFALAHDVAAPVLGVLAATPAAGASGRVIVVGEATCSLEPHAGVQRGDRLAPSTTAPGKGRKAAPKTTAYAVALGVQGNGESVPCLVGAPGLAP